MTKIFEDMPRSPLLRIVLLLTSVTAILSVFLALWVTIKPPVVASPSIVTFSNLKIDSSKNALCPGEILTFAFDSTVDYVPAVIVVTYSWWSVDLQDAARFGEEELFSIRTEMGTMTKTLFVKIPPLNPGRYEFRFGSSESYTLPSILSVPFSVPDGCSIQETPQVIDAH